MTPTKMKTLLPSRASLRLRSFSPSLPSLPSLSSFAFALAVSGLLAGLGLASASGMEGERAGELRDFGGIEMVWCPPGEFLMGSPEDEEGRFDGERQDRVTLTQGFWLAKYECTQAQWGKAVKDNPSRFKGADLPVEMVSWDHVQVWLAEMNERHPLPEGWEWNLPTEAQWEYACRAGEAGPYGGTGELEEMGWYVSNSGRKTRPAGGKAANAWGLYDMHGNVWEWCRDWYGEHPQGGLTDPTGAESGKFRVKRGGSWLSSALNCRAGFRAGLTPDDQLHIAGFRPAAVRVSDAPSPSPPPASTASTASTAQRKETDEGFSLTWRVDGRDWALHVDGQEEALRSIRFGSGERLAAVGIVDASMWFGIRREERVDFDGDGKEDLAVSFSFGAGGPGSRVAHLLVSTRLGKAFLYEGAGESADYWGNREPLPAVEGGFHLVERGGMVEFPGAEAAPPLSRPQIMGMVFTHAWDGEGFSFRPAPEFYAQLAELVREGEAELTVGEPESEWLTGHYVRTRALFEGLAAGEALPAYVHDASAWELVASVTAEGDHPLARPVEEASPPDPPQIGDGPGAALRPEIDGKVYRGFYYPGTVSGGYGAEQRMRWLHRNGEKVWAAVEFGPEGSVGILFETVGGRLVRLAGQNPEEGVLAMSDGTSDWAFHKELTEEWIVWECVRDGETLVLFRPRGDSRDFHGRIL